MASKKVLICFKDTVVKQMDELSELSNFRTRSEFVREAVRRLIEQLKREDARLRATNALSTFEAPMTVGREQVLDALQDLNYV